MKNRSYTEVKQEAQDRVGWRELEHHEPTGRSRRLCAVLDCQKYEACIVIQNLLSYT